MTAAANQPKTIQHFAPFLAMYVGAGFGWFAIWRHDEMSGAAKCAVGQGAMDDFPLWAGRVLALVSAMAIWALYTTTANNKAIHGGGLFDRNPADARHLAAVTLSVVVTWCIGAVAFATLAYKVFVFATVAHIVFLCGEVGWKDPLYLPNRLRRLLS